MAPPDDDDRLASAEAGQRAAEVEADALRAELRALQRRATRGIWHRISAPGRSAGACACAMQALGEWADSEAPAAGQSLPKPAAAQDAWHEGVAPASKAAPAFKAPPTALAPKAAPAPAAQLAPPPPPPPSSTEAMPPGRAGLMCANPKCWYLVHTSPGFGGYCCKKCHWLQESGSKSKKHGVQCQCVDAPEGAPRAPPVPPDTAWRAEPIKANSAADSWAASPPQAVTAQPAAKQSSWQSSAASAAVGGDWSRYVGGVATSSSLVGRSVQIRGFVTHHFFNGLPARIELELPDGRFDLRLADGTRLRYVKPEHFERIDG